MIWLQADQPKADFSLNSYPVCCYVSFDRRPRAIMLRIVASFVAAVSLSGCGSAFFASRTTNPVVWDTLGKYQALSTEAGRRTVLFRKDGMVCAEPPADALEAYANAFSAAAKASGNGPVPSGTVTVDVSGNVARAMATSTAPFMYRTQGLQFMRDASFNLCIMLLNGVINNAQYVEL